MASDMSHIDVDNVVDRKKEQIYQSDEQELDIKNNSKKETKLQRLLGQIDTQFHKQMSDFLKKGRQKFQQRRAMPSGISLYEDILFLWSFKQQQQMILKDKRKTLDAILRKLEGQTNRKQVTIKERVEKKLAKLSVGDIRKFMISSMAIHFDKKMLNNKMNMPLVGAKTHVSSVDTTPMSDRKSFSSSSPMHQVLNYSWQNHGERVKLYTERFNTGMVDELKLEGFGNGGREQQNVMEVEETDGRRKARLSGVFFYFQKQMGNLYCLNKDNLERLISEVQGVTFNQVFIGGGDHLKNQQMLQEIYIYIEPMDAEVNNHKMENNNQGEKDESSPKSFSNKMSLNKMKVVAERLSQMQLQKPSSKAKQLLQQKAQKKQTNPNQKIPLPNINLTNISLPDILTIRRQTQTYINNLEQLNSNQQIKKTLEGLYQVMRQIGELQGKIKQMKVGRGEEMGNVIQIDGDMAQVDKLTVQVSNIVAAENNNTSEISKTTPQDNPNLSKPQPSSQTSSKDQTQRLMFMLNDNLHYLQIIKYDNSKTNAYIWSQPQDQVLSDFINEPIQCIKEMMCLLRYKNMEYVMERYKFLKWEVSGQVSEELAKLAKRGVGKKEGHMEGIEIN